MASPSEQEQWERSASDGRSVLAFYRAHVDELFRYLSRLTGGDRERTEDLVQEVFVALVRAVRDGRVDVVRVGWLISTARFLFLHAERHDRRERRRVEVVGAWRDAVLPFGAELTSSLAVRSAVQQLSDVERAALVFRYVEDLPVQQVATMLDRSVDATESLLARARRRLRGLLEEDDDRGS
jgi:RNA polymerase sigma-70 factor, ECF subfamily